MQEHATLMNASPPEMVSCLRNGHFASLSNAFEPATNRRRRIWCGATNPPYGARFVFAF